MWIQKPPLGVPINFSHLLVRELKLAVLFNECAGGIVNDSSQNGYMGTLTNFSFPSISTSGWIPGRDGKTLATDDINDWVDFGDVLDMGTSSFTVFVRFVAPNRLTTSVTGGRLIQKRGTGTAGSVSGWTFAFYQIGGLVKCTNSVIDDSSHNAGIGPLANVFIGSIGDVINLVVVVDRESGEWRTYADNTLVSNVDMSAVTGSLDNARKLTLGGSDVSATQYGGYEYIVVMLWQRALTLNEIQQVTANPYRIYKHIDLALLAQFVEARRQQFMMII